jgi:DNA-binding response OmpR family regulator
MASESLRFHLSAITRHLARVEELLAKPPARADPVARRLRSRPVLRQLFDTFLAAPDRHLTRDAIAHAMWNTAYDPLRHDNTLRSSIRRLRAVLRGRAEIRCERGGYQLCGHCGAPAVIHGLVASTDSSRGRSIM